MLPAPGLAPVFDFAYYSIYNHVTQIPIVVILDKVSEVPETLS